MAISKIRADAEGLAHARQNFAEAAAKVEQMTNRLRQRKEVLQNGDWIGLGATAFYAEMDNMVLPALRRLHQALAQTGCVTKDMATIAQQAEQEAANCFQL